MAKKPTPKTVAAEVLAVTAEAIEALPVEAEAPDLAGDNLPEFTPEEALADEPTPEFMAVPAVPDELAEFLAPVAPAVYSLEDARVLPVSADGVPLVYENPRAIQVFKGSDGRNYRVALAGESLVAQPISQE